MKTLALFDFDGTLYNKDSLIEFTIFANGKVRFYQGLLMLFPSLSGLKLGILNNEKVKVKFLTHFFKDDDVKEFKALAQNFATTKIEKDLNKKTFEYFLKHLESNHTVCIVSASSAYWIEPWSEKYKVPCIGTELETIDGKITGKFTTKNCYGPEKVNRIKAVYDLEQFDVIKVYGSGKGDREMLQLSKG
ncbi:HAD-IB family hydrolase [Flavobacterium sp.]|uniref:HAD-IB family hydrolase n=1 Tax=Flavobacterium sp. TaxID=239 RepID=UPI00260E5E30|nr:HAD-IB family hydrolase [Flavobacterium sp.]